MVIPAPSDVVFFYRTEEGTLRLQVPDYNSAFSLEEQSSVAKGRNSHHDKHTNSQSHHKADRYGLPLEPSCCVSQGERLPLAGSHVSVLSTLPTAGWLGWTSACPDMALGRELINPPLGGCQAPFILPHSSLGKKKSGPLSATLCLLAEKCSLVVSGSL